MQDDQEHMKRCAYRFAWPRRTSRTPSGKTVWGGWFESKFGEDIEAYHRRLYQQAQEKLYAR